MGHLQSQREISMETDQTWADRCLRGRGGRLWFLPCHHNLPPVSTRAMFEPLGVPFCKVRRWPSLRTLVKRLKEKLNEVGNHTEGGQKQQAIVETALDVKLGSHLCELRKVALWCFLEPDTCGGENSLLSTCGELRAPLRALNLKPFKQCHLNRA